MTAPRSTIRTVIDPAPAIVVDWLCLTQIGDRYCHLARHHAHSCLTLPRWPKRDITADNPRYQARSAA